jgi:hypothetical protein
MLSLIDVLLLHFFFTFFPLGEIGGPTDHNLVDKNCTLAQGGQGETAAARHSRRALIIT